MNFAELPKRKSLWYRIAFALVAAVSLFAIAGCASADIMTKKVDLAVKQSGSTIDGLRFIISTNVTLVRTHQQVLPDPLNVPRPIQIRALRTRDVVRLTAKTKGRLIRGNVDSGLHVSFEERGGTFPTLEFKQKSGIAPDEKFYFMWNTYPTGERYIIYEGVEYMITYEGDEEPYLLYMRLEREKRTSRRMPGIR